MGKMLKKLNLNSVDFDGLTIVAASDEDGGKTPTFKILAYNGGKIRVSMWDDPVVVDLNGLQVRAGKPVFYNHRSDLENLIGQVETIEKRNGKLVAEGPVIGESETAKTILMLNKKGYRFQASISVDVYDYYSLQKGEKANVNSQTITGPATVITKSKLSEISFVLQGADENTSAKIAAAKEEEIQMENKIMSEKKKEVVAASQSDPKVVEEGTVETTQKIEAAKQTDNDSIVNKIRSEAAAEAERIAAIRSACLGNHPEIEARAIREGWSEDKTKLEVLRAERPSAPNVIGRNPVESLSVLEAAALMSGGISADHLVKKYDESIIEAADTRYKGRIGLQQMIMEAARANGCSVMYFREDPRRVLEAAFPPVKAAFSTVDLAGIMSNVANKFLLQGFESEESVWRQIAARRPVNDFKTITSYRLTGAFEFDEIGPTGELKHGTLSDESFTNRARTHGKMFTITREDLYNDDLGALTALPAKIGRGGHKKLNKVFWTEFLDNSDFFTEDRENFAEGGNTALSVEGLALAELMFLDQEDADGSPLGVDPRILLVPSALGYKARQLMASVKLGAESGEPETNPFAGMFKPVVSRYLSNNKIAGSSATAWYLLADPNDIAVIEVCFLNGKEMPTVESADADFNVLGIQFRGYFDFGVAKQDWRAGVKMKGTA